MPFRSLYPEVALTSYVLEPAAARGDKPALIDGPSGRTITYGQLPALVARAAAAAGSHLYGTATSSSMRR